VLCALCCVLLPQAWAFESELRLRVGEIQPLPVQAVQRIAIGDPNIADVSIVSAEEILVKALDIGTTNLIIWDSQGQTTTRIVVQSAPPEERIAELERLLVLQQFDRVQVKQEGDRIFLMGEVETPEQLEAVSKITAPYPEVVSLVQAKAAPAPEIPLVQLNLAVVELTKDYQNNLGIDWADSIKFTETTFSAPKLDLQLRDRVTDALRIGSYSRESLNLTLSALAKDNKARILSEPRLVTLSGKPAEVFVGGEKPVITTSTTGTGSGVTSKSVEFKSFGITLKITPVVAGDRSRVTSAIDAEVSSLDNATATIIDGVTIPGFKVRRATTEIAARSGETIFIAGLLSSEDSKALAKVPGVGDIPVLGRLFTSRDWNLDRTELVITVTQTIVEGPATAAAISQALATAAQGEDPLTTYARHVQERVAAALPATPAGQAGTVRVRLHLFADGHLAQTILTQSSGYPSLDDLVIRAVESQAPYPIFPQALMRTDAWMEIPVVFQGSS